MNNTEGRLNGIGVATLIIFLAVTFVIAFFLHLISTSGDLAPFHTDLIMLVTTCMILAILYWLFFRKRKKHKRIKEVIEEIPFKLETRTAIEMEEMKTTGDLSVEQVIDWREPEHGLQQGEDRRLEDLAHLRRIDTVEEMASIMAHELNQPLCAILNYSNVCVRLMKCSDNVQNKMADAIEEINIQAKRARQIIKGLRRLVVDHEPRLPTVHVNNDIVHEVVSIMQAEARQKNINIQTKLAHNIPIICIDNIQIIQVLLNLVRNAFDAVDNTDIAYAPMRSENRSAG